MLIVSDPIKRSWENSNTLPSGKVDLPRRRLLCLFQSVQITAANSHCWVCVCVPVGDRFVFCVLGSVFLCLCSCLLCLGFVFCVHGSMFLLFLFLSFLDLGFFFKFSGHVIFCFQFCF